MKMRKRRNVLKTTGLLAMTGIMGTGSAKEESRKIPASEVGLSEEIEKLLRENNIQETRILLEKHDIRHNINKREFEFGQQRDGIKTQGWIAPKDKAEVYCTLVHTEGDRWLATGFSHVPSGSTFDPNIRDAKKIGDAVGLSWDNAEWTSPERTQDNLWFSAGFQDADNDQLIQTEYDEYNRYGVCGSVYFNTEGPVYGFWVNIQTDILRRNNHPDIGVKFEYEHTFALHSASISPGITAGGLNVSIPAGAGSWSLEETADP